MSNPTPSHELSPPMFLLSDAWHTLDLARYIHHPPLKDVLLTGCRDTLRDALQLLESGEAASAAAPDELPSSITEKSSHVLNTPEMAPVQRPPQPAISPIDLRSTATGSTRRATTLYQDFMSQVLPSIRAAYPLRSQKVNFQEATQLWGRHKAAGSLAAIIAAALCELPAPVANPTGLRSVAVELASASRFRSLSADSAMPDLEDAY